MPPDAQGGIWIAHWGGARISRFLPDGRLDRVIPLPTSNITSVAFAGDGLDRMFVTSASLGCEGETHAGALFEVDAGVVGLTDAPVQRVNLHANTVCTHKMASLHRMRRQTHRTFHRFRTQAGGLVPSSIK